MRRGLSLADKCLAVFGGAVVVIVVAAMTAPWFRMNELVDAGQLDVSRQMARTWDNLDHGGVEAPRAPEGVVEHGGILARRLTLEQAQIAAGKDMFVRYAVDQLTQRRGETEVQDARWVGTSREYRFAAGTRNVATGDLEGLIILERRSVEATRLLLVNTGFLLSAGAVVLFLSLVAFYFLMHKVILGPVRALKDTAERVREGNLAIRSDIRTGDEFEQLAETFNQMLGDLQTKQDQLRGTNAALDLKIDELKSTNLALHEAAKLKGEFLANVSHELRTPLNSIIGFAELLLEIARHDGATPDPPPQVLKRVRYGENIVSAGRNLLGMINSLLEMAKIEAGRVQLELSRTNLRDVCEGLMGLAYPLAEKKGIQLKLELADDLPAVETDVKKLQQIVFNFLSNAVKFTESQEKTGRVPQVALRAERLTGGRGGPEGARTRDGVRISVIDNGPGIPPEEHQRIFEKFHQLNAGHTREHTGTGLGLAISKELAALLGGEIQLVSEPGRGSMFSVILPLSPEPAGDGSVATHEYAAAR